MTTLALFQALSSGGRASLQVGRSCPWGRHLYLRRRVLFFQREVFPPPKGMSLIPLPVYWWQSGEECLQGEPSQGPTWNLFKRAIVDLQAKMSSLNAELLLVCLQTYLPPLNVFPCEI